MKTVIGIFATLLAGVALAQAEGEPTLFEKLDANADGQISVFEAEANMDLLEQFNRLDTDGNGNLSRSEFAAYGTQGH